MDPPQPNPHTSMSETTTLADDPIPTSKPLPDVPEPDIPVSELTIAKDGSYIELTNATTALELKRKYDRQYGVGKPGVRSPYLITTVTDENGRQVYRLSSSNPGPNVSISPQQKKPDILSKSRRLRLSVGALLAPKVRPAPPTRGPGGRLVRNVRSTSELRSTGFRILKHESAPPNVMERLSSDGDAFSLLLGWTGAEEGSASSSKGSSEGHGEVDERVDDGPFTRVAVSHGDENTVHHPFGRGVTYATPQRPLDLSIRRPSSPPPQQLRYVQSFESGLTARADDIPRPLLPPPRLSPASPYSTDIFEVLQTYKGIPLANTLSAVSTETTFRLSSTLSAVPQNDPRFVIWGDLPQETPDEDLFSDDDEPTTHRRRASSVTDIPTPAAPQKVIVAATIERWIAQLTSELNYVELLDFFLTYRVYIRPIDLCQLLISRFHWAVKGEGGSHQEEIVKKIVRVRTFIAFRYWLSTFFQVDFLRDRELCKLLTGWLNSLKADQGIVGLNADVLDIVRKLKRIVRECKEKWFRGTKSSAASSTASSESSQFSDPKADNQDADVDLDVDNAASSTSPPPHILPESVISPPRPSDATIGATTGLSQLHDLQATILAQAKPATNMKPVPPTLPMHQSAISRALVNTMGKLGRWKRVLNSRSTSAVPCADAGGIDLDLNSDSDRELTAPRAFPVRRMLGHGGSGWSALNASRRERERSESSVLQEIYSEAQPQPRLLRTASAIPLRQPQRTSLARPLSYADPEREVALDNETRLPVPPMQVSTASPEAEPVSPPGLEVPMHLQPRLHKLSSSSSMRRVAEYKSSPLKAERALPPQVKEEASTPAPPPDSLPASVLDAHSSNVGDAFDDELPPEDDEFAAPEIVALDDFDLSSSGSDSGGDDGMPRLRRPQRRLPTRRDFEFVRRSIDSVSSLGIRSSDAHSSMASSKSHASRASRSKPSFAEEDIPREIMPWQLDLIEDSDDEEPQGADAALARLEGQIDARSQKEKLKKVDRWMRMVAERIANLDHSTDITEEDEGNTPALSESAGTSASTSSVEVESSNSASGEEASNPVIEEKHEEGSLEDLLHQQREALGGVTPTPPPHSQDKIPPPLNATREASEADEHVPPTASTDTEKSFVVQRTSMATKRRGVKTSSLIKKADLLLTSKVASPMIGVHRSFILLHRAEDLAQHFAIIQRELFLTIKFGEVVVASWVDHEDHGEVLDWQAYVKQRAKIKVEAKEKGLEPKISDVAAVRARFNLMVGFVASDIVLSHPQERPIVFSKFVRIAFKSYAHNNFATVVSIMAGLQTPAVTTSMKRLWNRVPMYELRLLDDLKVFTNPTDNFKLIRDAVDVLADSRRRADEEKQGSPPMHSVANLTAKGKTIDGKAAPSDSCIPFLGVYLSDLNRFRQLPDYIDPTSPSTPVTIDKSTGFLRPPRHPEVFSTLPPLPDSVPLEPLINVQKQRLTAGVVKNIVAGQHLATKVQFDPDRRLYQKCLRLKALPPDKLMEVAGRYGGEM